MLIDNYAYVYAALRILGRGLLPFVEGQFQRAYGDDQAHTRLEQVVRESVEWQSRRYEVTLDVEALLAVMERYWEPLFRNHFKDRWRDAKAWVTVLRGVRNRCAHPSVIDSMPDDDRDHAVGTMLQLLTAIQAEETFELKRLRDQMQQMKLTGTAAPSSDSHAQTQTRIKLADAVWIGTALLHHENAEHDAFAVKDIVARVDQERLFTSLPSGVQVHASSHNVANKQPSPDKHRMLYETSPGRKRLFRRGDDAHPERTGKITPERSEIPQKYWYLLDWYRDEYDR